MPVGAARAHAGEVGVGARRDLAAGARVPTVDPGATGVLAAVAVVIGVVGEAAREARRVNRADCRVVLSIAAPGVEIPRRASRARASRARPRVGARRRARAPGRSRRRERRRDRRRGSHSVVVARPSRADNPFWRERRSESLALGSRTVVGRTSRVARDARGTLRRRRRTCSRRARERRRKPRERCGAWTADERAREKRAKTREGTRATGPIAIEV